MATEQVGRLRYVTAVDGGLEAFPLSIVIFASVRYPYESQRSTHCSRWTEYCHVHKAGSSRTHPSCDSSVANTFHPTFVFNEWKKIKNVEYVFSVRILKN